MQTIACCSFKGGTAKTSTVLHLGVYLAKQFHKRVLLIDFDAQANLSTGLGLSSDGLDTMVPVLQGQRDVREVIQKSSIENLDVVAANVFLDGVEATGPIVNDLYGHERLRRSLKDLDYDFVFIDTPPSLGWLTQSAFFAANYSIICAIPEPYSILALNRLKEYHERIQEHHRLEILGVILSFWDQRGSTNMAYVKAIENAFPDLLFDAKVRRDIAVSKSVLQGLPVLEAYPNSRASEDYSRLTAEFLRRISASSHAVIS
ncbi:MAG: ParA family protein [Verrucomicrobia bacterium]|nr:ParA family protein [Verrucomicrobiota bacterium]